MFPASTDERFDKLPKWLRDKVQELERRNSDLAKRLAEYETQATEETPIRIVGFDEPYTAIPDRSTIRFMIGKFREECIEVGFEYDNSLCNGPPIGVSVRSGGRVYIEPQASNVFVAKCEMRADRVQKRDARK
jgi:endonuclease YncB( thermonuclease family)